MYTNSVNWWLLSPNRTITNYAYVMNSTGYINGGNLGTSSAVRPALYLSSDLTLSGSGTQSDPYTIS